MNLIYGSRFDEPGYDYHVIHKAVANTRLFRRDSDREKYIRHLRTVQMTEDASMQAMALMTNHTHGLLGVRTASHSNFMQRWGGMYVSSFNRTYGREGHLLGEPFWSRPILSAVQWLATFRYLSRNPLEAGIVRSIAELIRHPWTSLGAIMGKTSRTEQDVAAVLAHFADDPDEARRLLIGWVSYASEFDPYASVPCPVALAQVEAIRSRAFRNAYDRAVAQYEARQILTLPDITRWACAVMSVRELDLLAGSRVPIVTTARSVVAFVGVQILGLSQTAVARHLGISQPATYKAIPRGRAAFEERFGEASRAKEVITAATALTKP